MVGQRICPDRRRGGAGAITVNGGAKIANAADPILGVSAGGNGSLMVSGVGTQFDTIGEVDVGMAGAGDLQVENGATPQNGGNISAPSQGFDVADAQGGSGDAVTAASIVAATLSTSRSNPVGEPPDRWPPRMTRVRRLVDGPGRCRT